MHTSIDVNKDNSSRVPMSKPTAQDNDDAAFEDKCETRACQADEIKTKLQAMMKKSNFNIAQF